MVFIPRSTHFAGAPAHLSWRKRSASSCWSRGGGPQPPVNMFPILPLLREGLVLSSALCLLVSVSVPLDWPFLPAISFTDALHRLTSETCCTYSQGLSTPEARLCHRWHQNQPRIGFVDLEWLKVKERCQTTL